MREGKNPYQPSTQKRFEISADSFSRERAHLVRDCYLELSHSFPEVHLAFSLFGSLSKGKVLTPETAPHSDIDLYLFVDEEDTLRAYETLAHRFPEIQPVFEAFHQELTPTIAAWQAAATVIEKQLHHASSSRIPDLKLPYKTVPIALHGEHSLLSQLQHAVRVDSDEYISELDVAAAWHLDIGDGLRRYRQPFLRELSQVAALKYYNA